MLEDLKAAEKGSVVVLHACAHNPTGVDPTRDQWERIVNVVRERELLVFFDAAYLGFASGNYDADAFPIRYAIEQGITLFLAISFAKNLVFLLMQGCVLT
jgi:aspartate aminotransferase, mitochondrial